MNNQNTIPNRNRWFIDDDGVINKNLQLNSLFNIYIDYMTNRTLRMFEYDSLPDGIIARDIEKVTQKYGKAFFIKHNDRYYVLDGSFSNYVTWNYEPKDAIIVNPALPNLKSNWVLDVDCVAIANDSLYIGLMPLFESNAIQLANVDISIMYAAFNTRFKGIITANDDNDKASIDNIIKKVFNGELINAIAVNETLMKDTINVIPYNTGSSTDIKDLIELKQYLKANWYIDLGINANYNMKREAINENEATMNDDALLPLIDDMLECRKRAIDKINELFGLNISVKLSSAWAKLREEIKLDNDLIKSNINDTTEEPTSDKGGEDDEKTS